MKSRFLLFPALLLLLSFCSTPEEKKQEVDYSIAIDSSRSILQAVQLESQVPGLSVTVSVDGKVVWSEGLGYSDIESRKTVDPSKTLFRIGSVSKPLTAIALAKLYEEGKLDLDAKIQTYVPYFPEKSYPITVRQVGGHIAGIRHYRGNENFSDKYYPTVREGLEIFINDSLLFQPGTNYRYSSYGWNLLSAVVEGASGEEFIPYMRKNVFQAMELNNTREDLASESIPDRSSFYYLDSGVVKVAPYVDNSYKWAGGGFISTSEDLTKFGNALMYGNIIKKETFDQFTEPQVINDTTSTGYGIGWRKAVLDDGRTYIGHSGGSVGGITQFAIYPGDGIVVTLLSNSSDVNYNSAHHRIAAHFAEAKKAEIKTEQ